MEGRYVPDIVDARGGRVYRYLATQDCFWPIHDWPNFVQDIAVKARKNNRERFTMFFFLVANGIEHHTAARWVLMSDIVNGAIVSDPIPKHHLHMDQLKTQAAKPPHTPGSLWQGNKKVMDMAKGYVTLQ